MKKLNIDNEFKTLIPPLASDEYDQLAKNLINEGCRDALVIWNDTIIDGHNRYSICLENKIPYAVKEMDFNTREEAIEWIIRNQFGRRNLSNVARVKLSLKLKDVIQEMAKKRMLTGKKDPRQELAQGRTNEELGKIAGVSKETIRQYEVIQKEATDEVKEAVDNGEMSINKGFKETKPKAEVVEEVEETRVCTMCGKRKNASDFSGTRDRCNVCRAMIKRSGLSTAEAKELLGEPDIELREFYEKMKNPTSATTDIGESNKNIDNPIIAELDKLLKNIQADLNRYTLITNQETNNGTKKLIDSIIEDLTTINSKIKERN